MKKILIRILAVIFLLPGFILDVCFGADMLMSDSTGKTPPVDTISFWASDLIIKSPEIIQIPLMISVGISILPTFIFYFILTPTVMIGLMCLVNYLLGSILSIPFTGKIQWRTLSSFAD